MRPIRRGDHGPAVAEIRASWSASSCCRTASEPSREFDAATERAVRAFQQSRGPQRRRRGRRGDLAGAGRARWRLGARTLYHAVPEPLIGDDVRTLQERLLEMGYDVGRADGVYGARTARAVAQFQREVGLAPDGACGPQTMNALRRLGRKVVGGRPQRLREAEAFRQSGPDLVGKTIVIDPGHGGDDPGVVVPDGPLRWTEAELAFDLATRLEGRLAAAGMRVHLTRGPVAGRAADRPERAAAGQRARRRPASSRCTSTATPTRRPTGVATYHYGTDNGVDARPWASGWPGWCSGRSSRAPACATARPTPRPGTCCG